MALELARGVQSRLLVSLAYSGGLLEDSNGLPDSNQRSSFFRQTISQSFGTARSAQAAYAMLPIHSWQGLDGEIERHRSPSYSGFFPKLFGFHLPFQDTNEIRSWTSFAARVCRNSSSSKP